MAERNQTKSTGGGRGGARPGAGRPKGAETRKTRLIAEAAKAAGLLPLDFMLSVLRDEKATMAMRLDASKAAAQYVHPRLSAVEVSGLSAAQALPPISITPEALAEMVRTLNKEI